MWAGLAWLPGLFGRGVSVARSSPMIVLVIVAGLAAFWFWTATNRLENRLAQAELRADAIEQAARDRELAAAQNAGRAIAVEQATARAAEASAQQQAEALRKAREEIDEIAKARDRAQRERDEARKRRDLALKELEREKSALSPAFRRALGQLPGDARREPDAGTAGASAGPERRSPPAPNRKPR